MRLWTRYRREEGFTLLEVLAAITILSIASLALTAFFVQAMSNAKENQNKTVAVNLARNALFYLEKQSYGTFKTFFTDHSELDLEGCERQADNVVCSGDQGKTELFRSLPNLWDVLAPEVNGLAYQISVAYKPDLLSEQDLSGYLIPIAVTAASADDPSDKRSSAEVEGYITHEKIR